MRIKKALDYIRKHGNPMDKYRVEYLLNKRSEDAIPLKYLEDIQNEMVVFHIILKRASARQSNKVKK